MKVVIHKYRSKYTSIGSISKSWSKYFLVVIIVHSQLMNVSSQTCGFPLPTATTSIAYGAYSTCTSLTIMTIPSTVTYIGKELILIITGILLILGRISIWYVSILLFLF